ncbi:MAG: GntR family transcriptional regulator [Gaiellaceae bacterium]
MATSPPLTERVSSELEGRIVSGAYAPGEQLPSEADLCAELGVSRPTLRDAIARLETRGLVRRERGRGTYISDGNRPAIMTLLEANLSITEMIEAMGLRAGTSEVTAAFEAPRAELVRSLGIRSRDAVLVVRRVRTADGHPAVFSVDYLPLWIPELPKEAEAYYGSLYALLERCCGEPVGGALARIEPTAATGEVAERLGLEGGSLLLALHQTHDLAGGRRVLYSTDYLRTDVFTIYVRRALDRPAAAPRLADDTNHSPTARGGTR